MMMNGGRRIIFGFYIIMNFHKTVLNIDFDIMIMMMDDDGTCEQSFVIDSI